MHTRLCRLHRIVLIVDGRGRAREIVDFVNLDVEREGHVMTEELKIFVLPEVTHIALRASCEIVDAKHLMSISQEPVAKMRPQEPSPSCDKNRTSHSSPLCMESPSVWPLTV